MGANERRQELLRMLEKSQNPLSGSRLAKQLGVSRQVIVQDVALLRAADNRIISTNKGYIFYKEPSNMLSRSYQVKHSTQEIEEELCIIVDLGGRILDVAVSHGIYGDISTELIIKSRQDVYDFVEKLKEGKVIPLKDLSGDVHLHTVEAESEEILDRIEEALDKKGLLHKD